MSEQEQGATSAFGTTPEGTPEPDFLSDYEEAPEPQVAETEPGQPEVPGPEATPDKEPEEPETPEEPPGPVAASDHLLPADLIEVLGGRFEGKTVADFVAAYRNAES